MIRWRRDRRPARSRAAVAANGLRKVCDEHRHEERLDADGAGLEDRRGPERASCGMPSRTISEDERPPGLCRTGFGGSAHRKALDENLRPEEQGRPGEEPDRDPSVPGRGLERFVHELIRHRADEHSRAEGHDQAHVPGGQRDESSDRTADDERRPADDTPEERLAHRLDRHGSPGRWARPVFQASLQTASGSPMHPQVHERVADVVVESRALR